MAIIISSAILIITLKISDAASSYNIIIIITVAVNAVLSLIFSIIIGYIVGSIPVTRTMISMTEIHEISRKHGKIINIIPIIGAIFIIVIYSIFIGANTSMLGSMCVITALYGIGLRPYRDFIYRCLKNSGDNGAIEKPGHS